MKAVIQRVNSASVEVDNKIIGKINKGILVFLGISKDFNEYKLDWMINKIPKIRIFNSEKKGFDLSVKDISGEILIVPQFTLHGVINANKPNFRASCEYDRAKDIFFRFVARIQKESRLKVETGEFGAMMKVNLENDGPVTLILEK